jgi:hypothetical protein
MAEDSLRSAIDAIRSRLHEELETQLEQLSSRHAAELESARRTAEAEAEQRWAPRVEAVRTEWTTRLESEIASVRSEAERRMVAEAMRLRVEAEQAAAESAARVREELEQALASERERASQELAEERQRLNDERQRLNDDRQRLTGERDGLQRSLEAVRAELDSVRGELTTIKPQLEALGREVGATHGELDRTRQLLETTVAERDSAARQRDEAGAREHRLTSELTLERHGREEDARRQQQAEAAVSEARIAERQSQLATVERVLNAIKTMDTGRSLSDVLGSLIVSAGEEAPRVALFVVNGGELRGWKSTGFDAPAASLQASVKDEGLLGEALRRREPAVTADGTGLAAPAFAALPAGRAAMAVPLLVGAQPVAVLYADDSADGTPAAPASWPEAIQILGRHASVILAHLTAARAAEAMRRSLTPAAVQGRAGAPAGSEDGNSARRYARLLVSEIKLYNEAAVSIGRQKRDLLARLKPEIERARSLYAQRISSAVDSRGALFQQELVQTLADGDASLLGNPA